MSSYTCTVGAKKFVGVNSLTYTFGKQDSQCEELQK